MYLCMCMGVFSFAFFSFFRALCTMLEACYKLLIGLYSISRVPYEFLKDKVKKRRHSLFY